MNPFSNPMKGIMFWKLLPCSSTAAAAGFLLALLFYHEDGGSKFVENVGEVLDHAALYPRRLNYSTPPL
jgi:hypothetical protein